MLLVLLLLFVVMFLLGWRVADSVQDEKKWLASKIGKLMFWYVVVTGVLLGMVLFNSFAITLCIFAANFVVGAGVKTQRIALQMGILQVIIAGVLHVVMLFF